jgi:RND family efflux transporter MFP subunit
MKKIIVIALVLIVAVSAVTLLKKRQNDLKKSPIAAVLPVVVDTARLRTSSVSLTLPAMGLVDSDLSTTLSTKVSGRVTKVYKQEGDRVNKGDKLASIDASDLLAKKEGLRLKMEGIGFQIAGNLENIKALKTSLISAQETHARTLELLAVKGASQEQSRQEEANIAAIQAKISAAQNGISTLNKSKDTLDQNIKEIDSLLVYTQITAPIDGTLSKRLVMAGDLAMPGKTLFRIAARTGLYVNLSLPNTVHPAKIIVQGKELPLTAKNEASAAGLAQYIAPLPDDAGLVEGQYLNVQVVVYEKAAVLVPVDGLLSVNGNSFVFIFQQGKAVKTPVDIVARGQEGVVVRPDLSGKTILIAKPDILLRAAAGAPVLESGDRVQGAEGGQNNG